MSYDRLPDRLRAGGTPTVSTLPDGSVDRYATLSAGALGPFETREAFGREVREGTTKSFPRNVESVEAGGQAVNAARQADALGADVTCYGHLDHPVHDDLPFETVSMGDPADVDVFCFRDGDVMVVGESDDIADWTLEDLRAVAPLPAVFGADAVCCVNWVSFPGMEQAFHALADADLPRRPFVFDPGDVVGSSPAELRALRDATAALGTTFDVVLSANRGEVRALAAILPNPPEDDADKVAALREATGIEAVVLHGYDAAVAAVDGEGLVSVPNYDVADPARHTGGGDRFGGGLSYALALDWDWEAALACGNVCAARYAATGETADAEALAAFVEEHGVPD